MARGPSGNEALCGYRLVSLQRWSFLGRSQSCLSGFASDSRGALVIRSWVPRRGRQASGKGSWTFSMSQGPWPRHQRLCHGCGAPSGESLLEGFGCCWREPIVREGSETERCSSTGCAWIHRLSALGVCEPGWSRGDSSSPATPPLPSC